MKLKTFCTHKKQVIGGGVILSLLVLLVACGGGNSEKAQTRNLPDAPGFFEKDATIEGVDANQNGVRDEVELLISKSVPLGENGDDSRYQKILANARIEQELLTKFSRGEVKTRKEILDFYNQQSCVWAPGNEDIYLESIRETYKSEERQKVARRIYMTVGTIFSDTDNTGCPKTQ
jgi:hypothetical protein